jgi:hypothetical protein
MDMLIEGVWFSRITSVIRELLRWVWLMMLSMTPYRTDLPRARLPSLERICICPAWSAFAHLEHISPAPEHFSFRLKSHILGKLPQELRPLCEAR